MMTVAPRVRKWLTGPGSDPSVRTRFWLEVEGRPRGDSRVQAALKDIGRTGWAASLLEPQFPDGHWVTTRSTARDLYVPKYIVTNWIAIVLADLGMTKRDPRIRRTAELIMDRWGARGNDLSGRSGEVCVTGNAVRTLVRFGYLDHPVVQRAIAWIVRSQKSDGGWHCFPSKKGTLDGWEALAAFAEIPESERDRSVQRSVERGAEFFLHRHLMDEGTRYAPWFRIHYPNHYYYDILVGLRTLTRLGYGADRRLAPALRWLASKRARDGTWAMDETHPDVEPDFPGDNLSRPFFPMTLELLHQPSRWATVEALSVLARVENARAQR
jgi:hypothetical protein